MSMPIMPRIFAVPVNFATAVAQSVAFGPSAAAALVVQLPAAGPGPFPVAPSSPPLNSPNAFCAAANRFVAIGGGFSASVKEARPQFPEPDLVVIEGGAQTFGAVVLPAAAFPAGVLSALAHPAQVFMGPKRASLEAMRGGRGAHSRANGPFAPGGNSGGRGAKDEFEVIYSDDRPGYVTVRPAASQLSGEGYIYFDDEGMPRFVTRRVLGRKYIAVSFKRSDDGGSRGWWARSPDSAIPNIVVEDRLPNEVMIGQNLLRLSAAEGEFRIEARFSATEGKDESGEFVRIVALGRPVDVHLQKDENGRLAVVERMRAERGGVNFRGAWCDGGSQWSHATGPDDGMPVIAGSEKARGEADGIPFTIVGDPDQKGALKIYPDFFVEPPELGRDAPTKIVPNWREADLNLHMDDDGRLVIRGGRSVFWLDRNLHVVNPPVTLPTWNIVAAGVAGLSPRQVTKQGEGATIGDTPVRVAMEDSGAFLVRILPRVTLSHGEGGTHDFFAETRAGEAHVIFSDRGIPIEVHDGPAPVGVDAISIRWKDDVWFVVTAKGMEPARIGLLSTPTVRIYRYAFVAAPHFEGDRMGLRFTGAPTIEDFHGAAQLLRRGGQRILLEINTKRNGLRWDERDRTWIYAVARPFGRVWQLRKVVGEISQDGTITARAGEEIIVGVDGEMGNHTIRPGESYVPGGTGIRMIHLGNHGAVRVEE